MKITITKRGHRHELRCVRSDGSVAVTDLGCRLPYHDLAHLVVERQWDLEQGFFGHIARGFTFAQLSDQAVIRSLGPQSVQAEVLARALQSLASGACAADEFAELVNTELEHWRLPTIQAPAARVASIASEYRELTHRFQALGAGESLDVEFEPRGFRVCDGHDPEGNVIQFREPAGAGTRTAPRESSRDGVDFATLRELALALPDVIDSSTQRGMAFKARGKLLACKAVHRSAAPDSLVLRVGMAERARLLTAMPDICYLTPHYEAHESVLVRLPKVDRKSLQELLGVAWKFVAANPTKAAKRRKPGSVFRYL